MNNRITEKNVIFPALLLLAQAKFHLKDPNVPTSILKKSIFGNIEDDLSDEDLAPLKNRNDTKVEQVIRNLVSNKTLEKSGLATYDNEKRTLQITDAGLAYVANKVIPVMTKLPEIVDLQKKEIIEVEQSNTEEQKPRHRMR
ncbi:hypothetical protein ACTOJ1_000120 [Shigella flexneri]